MILHDQHVHSSYSEDSTEDLIKYYDLACKLGLDYFVTTEHIDYDTTNSVKDWLVDFDSLIKELNSFNGPVKTLLGVELGYRKDYLKELNHIINTYQFDIINLSIHDNGKDEFYFYKYFVRDGIKETLHGYYLQMLEAVKTFPDFDVLSHLDYAYKTIYKENQTIEFDEELPLIKEILSELIKRGKALEINTKVQAVLGENHLKHLLEIYKSLGGTKITISSDAHSIDRYKADFERFIPVIKEAGFSKLSYYVKRIEHHYDL